MDGDVLSLSSFSSLSSTTAAAAAAEQEHKDSSLKEDGSLSQSQQEQKPSEELWTDNLSPAGDRLLSGEEQVTLITESMSVTSTDQEKLLLLNKNTELRRVNKELMKLNEDWDEVYHSATQGLQHRLEGLELENGAIRQLNTRLLLKVEHQQSAKEYYERSLMEELKKNQELQEYVRRLESRLHQPERDCTPAKQGGLSAVMRGPASSAVSNLPKGPPLSPTHISGHSPSSSFPPPPSGPEPRVQAKSRSGDSALRGSQQEVLDLKEQLKALRCQTEIYEAEYQTEHNDHKHTQHENRRLRRKREEMRQQVALLQEQLKIYEDDFRRERSDKQMLQRLLLKKTPPNDKDPVLIHRCNNERPPQGGGKWTQSAEREHPPRKQHHPLCPKHLNRDTASD